MKDLRIYDNRAMSHASQTARAANKTLIVLHVVSPDDFKSHDRSARRIDFVLRNLECIKHQLAALNIPLKVLNVQPRKSIPSRVVQFCQEMKASHVFANLEYEVDELRQTTQTYQLARSESIDAVFLHDLCILPPGSVVTKVRHCD